MASSSPPRTPPRRGTPPPLLSIASKKQVSFRRPSTPQAPPARPFSRQNRPTSQGSNRLKEGFNERTPLMGSSPRRNEEVETLASGRSIMSGYSGDDWDDDEDYTEETKSVWYLILLTMAIGGLQIAWSVELSNGSPYLLGLGVSKSLLALVWIAGPLSGTLVQPYVGIRSDRCRSRFGKRRPFMVGGAAATIISLMLLAWTREIVGGVGSIFGIASDDKIIATAAIVFAVLMIYVLDFSINCIQAAIRAFIVDNAPTHQQDTANAWASRMTGVGNIVGYLFGYVNLPKYLWFFGDTQFKVLCVIASLAMAITLAISCVSISERDPRLDDELEVMESGVLAFFKGLWRSIYQLPKQISRICQVQFFAWIGWFPFLFYITTYIGEIYVQPYLEENPNMTPEELDALYERGTRTGTLALLVFAVATFTSSVFLPFIVAKSFHSESEEPRSITPFTPVAVAPRTPRTPGGKTPRTPRTPKTPLTPGGMTGTGDYFGYRPTRSEQKSKSKRSVFQRIGAFLRDPSIPWLTLRRAWLLSHVLFALLSWSTFFIHSTRQATILVGLIGIPWAMTNWAPYALIAAEISKRDNIRRGTIPPPNTAEGRALADGEEESEGADQAGVVLGIHNVAIAAPQVIATLVSSLIFRALQKPRGTVGDDSVAWVLRFGGLCTLMAAYMATRVGEEGDDEKS
ncbi:hypothetical protein B0A48_09483 [Cryoendolithus antarcticus]|uniref:General alpha-glucoside permease n=1 Tax=Cryoendolithus antarcticus TaxID=1507870 RepID=A0A1V8SZW5_9PEZI|nr:hypothetical protein B0A48_09483 [Cryoendolithus antarcticus]